ncbi:MAG: Gx transporter family protein [Clostridia bacterium]|nr:Gx transporter family protein [Clostridia bacterium]
MSRVKKIALSGVLTALALALSYFERFIPLGLIIPLPGVKLGLANIVTVAALYFFGPLPALAVAALRCALGSFFGGGVSSLLFSASGALLSWAAMSAVSRAKTFSVYGICLFGAAFHNIGQTAAAVLVLGPAVIYYLPYLLAVSLFTGTVTGLISSGVLSRVKRL